MLKDAVRLTEIGVVRDQQVILNKLSLQLPTGRVIGLLGPSGAGKTTLMRVIVGLQRLQAGTAEVLGRPAGDRRLRPRIGYATQSLAVYADLTVRENLQYFAAMTGARPERAGEVLREVDLVGQAGQLVRTLSGGQRARVSLAVALLGRPELLVLDEPTVGLDPVLRQQLWSRFQDWAAGGTTLLISSHVMDEAERCQDLVLMREGQIVAHGSPKQIEQQTGTATVEAAFLKLARGAS